MSSNRACRWPEVTKNCKNAAHRYVRWFGWRVLPVHYVRPDGTCSCRRAHCESIGKHPVRMGWTSQSAVNGADVETFWADDPDYNVGGLTGPDSGIWVLDVDTDKGGEESFRRLCTTEDGLPRVFQPGMRRHKTGGGGYHLVFRLPPGVTVKSRPLPGYPGIDVRGSGGMIVLPDSESGKGRYTVEVDDEVPPGNAPGWLLDLVREREYLPHTVAPDRNYARPEPVDRDCLPRKLQLGLSEGFREDEDRSRRFHRLVLDVKEAGYTEGQAITLLGEFCEFTGYYKALGRLPYLVHLSWSKHLAGLDTGIPATATPLRVEPVIDGSLAVEPVPLPAAEPPRAQMLTDPEDPEAWVPPVFTPDPVIDARLELACPEFDFAYAYEHINDAPVWVWEPIIQREGSLALYSVAKAGKSLITLEAVAALCSGRTPPGASRPRPPKHVAYFDRENPQRSIVKRLRAMGYKPEDFLPYLHYYRWPQIGFLDTPEGGALFVHLVKSIGAELVIIDTVSKFIEGEEDKAATINRLDQYAIQPLTRLGVAVLRLDHAGKEVERGQRGSSAKAAIGDGSYALVKTGNYIKLAGELRDDDSPEEILFVREDDPLRHAVATEEQIEQFHEMLRADKDDMPAPQGKKKRGRPSVDEQYKMLGVVAKLDSIDVPVGATWREAKALLHDAEVTFDGNWLASALKHRRDREARSPEAGWIVGNSDR